MYNQLPLTMLFSFLLWMSVIHTVISTVQLILIDRMAKKGDKNITSYSQMSILDKKAMRKALMKIAIGLAAMIALGSIKFFFSR